MWQYALKRLLLIIPTLVGILLIFFTLTQFVPGGPIDRAIAEMRGQGKGGEVAASVHSSGSVIDTSKVSNRAELEADHIEFLKQQFGFDKPLHIQFFTWLKNMFTFNFGDSYFRHQKVVEIFAAKLPVSMSLGITSFFLIYLICIPLGIARAVKQGSKFDTAASGIVLVAYSIPGFVFGMFLLVLFAGGAFVEWFPLRGLTSDNFDSLTTLQKIGDYAWHLVLPVLAYTLTGFAVLTNQTRNLFLEEMGQQYVQTARAKGLSEKAILLKHIFRNAMIIIIAGIPAGFVSMFFAGSLLIETMFSLDGLGLLMFEAVMKRDYPIVMAELFVFSLIGLTMHIVSDLLLALIDPRISFEKAPG
jgi:microcin C transport system permease protein